ncbi:hypothetical protein RJ55_07730 [Drechmeria coniospora]|nr:hypothetical protein RJ55_07730 [Drechmeria coniospora]
MAASSSAVGAGSPSEAIAGALPHDGDEGKHNRRRLRRGGRVGRLNGGADGQDLGAAGQASRLAQETAMVSSGVRAASSPSQACMEGGRQSVEAQAGVLDERQAVPGPSWDDRVLSTLPWLRR